MKNYVVLDKKVGETPLSCAEAWRAEHPEYAGVPLAYAGRLDPMASGKLLVLIGDECKNQTNYHDLDKEYEFSILFGIESDSLDVLGRLKICNSHTTPTKPEIEEVLSGFTGDITLPYPKFSAKTVQGKPLHMWTLEGKLNEIEIPTKDSIIYKLELNTIESISKEDLVTKALDKINSIPEVTDPRKALGNDFRRVDVRKDWQDISEDASLPETFSIAHLTCTASSGTYMRTLASEIAKKLHTCGLAWHIHRSQIGTFNPKTELWESVFND